MTTNPVRHKLKRGEASFGTMSPGAALSPLRGEGETPARKAQKRRIINWLALLPIAGFLLSGCAGGLFGPTDVQIGVIPSGPTTNAVVRTVFPYHGHYIKFQCAEPWPEGSVTITLTNTSKNKIMPIKNRGEDMVLVEPHTSALLYDGSLSNLLAGKRIGISSSGGRAACDLNFRFSPPTTLSAPIQIMCWCDAPSF